MDPNLLSAGAAQWKENSTDNPEWREPDTIFELPYDCFTCREQYYYVDAQEQRVEYRYAGELSVTSVVSLSRGFCTSIFEDLQKIKAVLRTYSDMINTDG